MATDEVYRSRYFEGGYQSERGVPTCRAIETASVAQAGTVRICASEALPRCGRSAGVQNEKKKDLALEEITDDQEYRLSEDERQALVRLQEANLYRCCRAGAIGEKLSAARILCVCKPTEERCPTPKQLSQISDIVELMLSYSQVELGETSLADWDEYDSWVERRLSRMPLFLDILDPTFLIIRGPMGAPSPPGIAAYLNTLLAGGNRLDGGLSAPPLHPVRRNAAEAPMPDMYQFADHQDAGIARAALIGWAADQGHGNLDFLRFTVGANGFAWL